MSSRKRHHPNVDLIGFLDIISILNVLILLIISTLALGLGVDQAAKSQREPNSQSAKPQVKPITNGGIAVHTPVSFMMCNRDSISIFDPTSGKVLQEFSSEEGPDIRSLMVTSLESRMYLAVKPSCFESYKLIASMVRSSGSSIGMEPIAENAKSPWDSTTR